MTLSEKLQSLRKQHGFSQEQLADLVGVSRQAISKWESGHSSPDLNNLIALSNIYQITIDNILKDGDAVEQTPKSETPIQYVRLDDFRNIYHYEYKSKLKLFGLPLVHINVGALYPYCAKGIIAIGNLAKGVFALGGGAIGVVAIGGGAIGVVSLGGLALGLLAIGGFAVGIVALGGGALGTHIALGGGAISNYIAMGGGAISRHIAVGGAAHAPVALSGEHDIYSTLVVYGEKVLASKETFLQAASQELPSSFWKPAIDAIANFLSNVASFRS